MNKLRRTEPKSYNPSRQNEKPNPKRIVKGKQKVPVDNSGQPSSSTDENDDESPEEPTIPEPHSDNDQDDSDPLAIQQDQNAQTSSNDKIDDTDPTKKQNNDVNDSENNGQEANDSEPQIESEISDADATESTAPNNNTSINQPDNHPNSNSGESLVGLNEDNGTANGASVVAVKSENEYAPLFDNHNTNDDEINNLLVDSDWESSGDEVEMTGDSSRFPMPLRATENDLFKRDGDKISGDIPFNESVN